MSRGDKSILALLIIWIALTLFVLARLGYHKPKPATRLIIDLKPWYAGFNERYFLNQLPANTVLIFADTGGVNMGQTQNDGLRYYITIDPDTNPTDREVLFTLFHEMCHVSVRWTTELDEHGPKFQACMHRLAAQGAFDDLW